MQAIILAGGKGTRLYPYTVSIPKPLVPVADLPIIDIVLRQLAYYGFKKVTIALGYMADMLEAFVGNGAKYGLKITYSREEKPLGTIAPLKLIKNLEDNFLVMNGDLLTNINYKELIDHHLTHKALATISTYTKKTKLQLGVIENDKDNRIVGFKEKPVLENKVSMGIYLFNKQIIKYIPDDEYFGFDSLMYKMIEKNDKVISYQFAGKWLDIGTHEDLAMATEEFNKYKVEFLPQK